MFRALVSAGFLLAAALVALALRDGAGVTGCGAGSGCAEVLASRWSRVFGIPVAIPAAALYAALLVADFRRNEILAWACLAALLGSVAWFAGLQLFAIGVLCPWCMTAHALALGVFGTGVARMRRLPDAGGGMVPGAVLGTAAMLALAVAQWLGPRPAAAATVGVEAGPLAGRSVLAAGAGRLASFAGGRMTFNVETLPRLGSVSAKHVLVEYFDYTCAACRTMGGYLDGLIAGDPARYAVIVLPVPLHPGCNPRAPRDSARHEGACEFARLALAVWRADPAAFPALHREWLLRPNLTPALAREGARRAVGETALARALSDPWVEGVLQAALQDSAVLSRVNDRMPKVLVRDQRVLHGLPDTARVFARVIEAELPR